MAKTKEANKSGSNQVSLNVDELKDFLRHIIKNNIHLQANNKNPVATEVVGESGIGKTSTMMQLANELGLNLVKLNLAQIEELGDLVGFPIRQFQMCKADDVDKKECIWIDEHAVDSYTKKGYDFTGEKQMSYCPPEWIADKKGGGILILDDYNRGDMRFLQACMELIDRQQYISWALPKGWNIILTCNPEGGDYLVNDLDVAQKTRFITANLKFAIEPWARWAEAEGIDGRCINFLLMHPELVTQATNARSITTFFNSISSFAKFEDNLTMIQLIGEGSVGPEFSTLFTTFINNKLDLLISPKDILTHAGWPHVKEQLEKCIGKGNGYRADIASILTTRIINYAVTFAEEHTVSDDMIKRIVNLATEDIMETDLKYFMVKNILNGNRSKFQKMMLDQKVVKMSVK